MRVIYVHQYFLTPEQGGAIRSYHLAKGMVDAGMEVEMITSHKESYYDFKIIQGIKVHYLPVAYAQRFGTIKRIWSFYKFLRLAKQWIKKLPRPDLLYISSTPLSTGWIGMWAKKKFALPYIFEVRDLWPEAPIQVGVIRNPLLKKWLYRMEINIYKHALKIVALSPGIANYIREKSPGANISIIPNFSDLDFFQATIKNPEILQEYGLKEEFTICYTGAIGKVNAVDAILDIAKIAQERNKPYQFVVMGKGTHLKALLTKAKDLGLSNFYSYPFGNKEKVRDLLSISDMAFISFEQHPVLKTNSPNKFFDALAAGKSIFVNHKGWVHNLVKSNSLGLYASPSKPLEAFQKIDELAQNPERLSNLQGNARRLAEKHFSKELAIQRLLMVLDPGKFGGEFKDEAYILIA
jgi:glycosyltransferase involved in cell wall biosynthesis